MVACGSLGRQLHRQMSRWWRYQICHATPAQHREKGHADYLREEEDMRAIVGMYRARTRQVSLADLPSWKVLARQK